MIWPIFATSRDTIKIYPAGILNNKCTHTNIKLYWSFSQGCGPGQIYPVPDLSVNKKPDSYPISGKQSGNEILILTKVNIFILDNKKSIIKNRFPIMMSRPNMDPIYFGNLIKVRAKNPDMDPQSTFNQLKSKYLNLVFRKTLFCATSNFLLLAHFQFYAIDFFHQ